MNLINNILLFDYQHRKQNCQPPILDTFEPEIQLNSVSHHKIHKNPDEMLAGPSSDGHKLARNRRAFEKWKSYILIEGEITLEY